MSPRSERPKSNRATCTTKVFQRLRSLEQIAYIELNSGFFARAICWQRQVFGTAHPLQSQIGATCTVWAFQRLRSMGQTAYTELGSCIRHLLAAPGVRCRAPFLLNSGLFRRCSFVLQVLVVNHSTVDEQESSGGSPNRITMNCPLESIPCSLQSRNTTKSQRQLRR